MKVTYVEPNLPVKQVYIDNGKGYFDLVINKNKNGKAIRIGQRFGEPRVHIAIDKINDLIKALELVRDKGVQVSVDDLELRTAA